MTLTLEQRIERLRKLISTAKAKLDELVHEQQRVENELRQKHQAEVRSRFTTIYVREHAD